MKLLKKLCCMELPSGTILIAVLGILGSLLNIVITIYAYSETEEYMAKLGPEYQDALKSAEIQQIIRLVMSVISLITSILLIVGVVTRNHFYLLPWLIQSAIGLALACIGFPIIIVALLLGSTPIGAVFLTFLILAVVLVISIYVFMGVYSCYIHLQGARRQNGQRFEFLSTDRPNV